MNTSDIFICQQCGQCCNGYGGTYITAHDETAIAAYVGIPRERFLKECCRDSGSRRVLAQGPDAFCIFYQDRRCTIHPVKPKMCREWPFIEAVLKDVSNWHKMASVCPGMRTDASDETILSRVRAARQRQTAGS